MRNQHEKRLKIYIETSVINHLDAPDRQDWMEDTLELWKRIKSGAYDVVIGTTVIAEITKCHEPKREFMLAMTREIDHVVASITDETIRLANEYVSWGGLPQKSYADAMHIALATLASCDAIVSWNFSHIVTVKAMTAVNAVNANERLKPIQLISPMVLLGDRP